MSLKLFGWNRGAARSFLRNVLQQCRPSAHLHNVESVDGPSIRALSILTGPSKLNSEYDVVIVGAGHNGLVAAAYLGRAGLKVAVIERRHVIGGAAVTEEIVPGFKFSRASYVLSLLRPIIYKELELKKHGLKVHIRNPSSYTPLCQSQWKNGGPRSLTLFSDTRKTVEQIAQFSAKDAEAYPLYEKYLEHIVSGIEPLLDNPPPNYPAITSKSLAQRVKGWLSLRPLHETQKKLGKELLPFYELANSSASKVLKQWFESEPLTATLATDGVIGAMLGPNTPGSGYVLLHHVMGEIEGIKGAWGYPEGGMGAVTQAIAKSAMTHGVHIVTSTPVLEIVVDNGTAVGVKLDDITTIKAKYVLSNATPKVTFIDLLQEGVLSKDVLREIKRIDYTSPVTKINLALKRIPNFLANPNVKDNVPMPHHQATIHLNCENTSILESGFIRASQGLLPDRPMFEMVIPSSLDPTLAPAGCHVCLLFTQYTPYHLANGKQWNEETKQEYLNIVLNNIEQYAPGFKESIVGGEVLSPVDLEAIFGLTGGNIFHGAMSLDQMFFSRPISSVTCPSTPIRHLLLCGSGAHPGGGVMGAPGRLAANAVLKLKR